MDPVEFTVHWIIYSSCEGIYCNSPETADKSGYYRIKDTQYRHTACHMMAITCFDTSVEKNF